MTTDIAPEKLAALPQSAVELESHEYRNEEDGDNYVVAQLYQADDGRKFRRIESSGMNSTWAGAGNFGQWLTEAESGNWKDMD